MYIIYSRCCLLATSSPADTVAIVATKAQHFDLFFFVFVSVRLVCAHRHITFKYTVHTLKYKSSSRVL